MQAAFAIFTMTFTTVCQGSGTIRGKGELGRPHVSPTEQPHDQRGSGCCVWADGRLTHHMSPWVGVPGHYPHWRALGLSSVARLSGGIPVGSLLMGGYVQQEAALVYHF